MNLACIRKALKFDYLMLLPVLGLAFYIAFIPHQAYPYPLHIDEWIHLTYSKAMLQTGGITFTDPFSGQGTVNLSSNLEAGFHLFWGVFQRLSGISWLAIFRYFPSIIFMFTVLSVFILARRQGFGWEAALFTCLIPTTIGILGPAFLVPVAMGLFFTPLILFLALNFTTVRTYLLLFVIISFLLAIHAPSAIIPIIVLVPYILLNLKGNFKHSLGLSLALALPFLIIFPWIFRLLGPTARRLLELQPLTEYILLPDLLGAYGYIPVLFCLLGILSLAMRGGRRNYGLALGLPALLLMLVVFYSLHYGVSILYERGLMYLMLIMGIIAGAGLMTIKNIRLPAGFTDWLRMPFISENAGRFLSLVLVAVTLAVVIPQRLATPYYHMIDEQDYQTFVWIDDNLGQEYEMALLDPWKATAFTAITGKQVYTRIHIAPLAKDTRAYDFLSSGSSDTTFLKQAGVSIIYARVYEGEPKGDVEYKAENPDLMEVTKNVYLFKQVEAGE